MSNNAGRAATVAVVVLAGLPAQAVWARRLAVGTCVSRVPQFPTIQLAVAAAAAGDTVLVCPGTYPEQVEITEPLTVRGVQAGTRNAAVITPPPGGMVPNAVNPNRGNRPLAAQILVRGTTGVTLRNLTVDGGDNGVRGCDPQLIGILYQNASGTVRNVATRNQVLGSGDEGCQSGLAIFVITDGSGLSSSVDIHDNSVHSYQVGGIVADFAGTNVTIRKNAVVGLGAAGPASRTFQNGIQVAFGATATVTGNSVIDNVELSGSHSSSAILVFGATVTGNRVGNSDTGIALFDTNTAGSNRVFGDGTHLFDGIYVCGSRNLVRDNVISGSQESGVNIVGPAFGCSGIDNTVSDNTISDACAGILVDLGTGVNTVSPNTFWNVGDTQASGSACPATPAIPMPATATAGTRPARPRRVD